MFSHAIKTQCKTPKVPPTSVILFINYLNLLFSLDTLKAVRSALQPLAEAWAGVRLSHTATYGIRRYTDGSWLIPHVDG